MCIGYYLQMICQLGISRQRRWELSICWVQKDLYDWLIHQYIWNLNYLKFSNFKCIDILSGHMTQRRDLTNSNCIWCQCQVQESDKPKTHIKVRQHLDISLQVFLCLFWIQFSQTIEAYAVKFYFCQFEMLFLSPFWHYLWVFYGKLAGTYFAIIYQE